MPSPRAIGIVRVSRTRGRGGESFASPTEQADRIHQACQREHLELLRIDEELDVSGGANLKDRPGLGPAVQAVEQGHADVIVAAYFDRFFRNTTVQTEVLTRVERAGGRVLAVDLGTVSAASAGQWLTGTLMGAISEYYRRANTERVGEALHAAIRRGVAPYGQVPAGYKRQPNGVYAPHERHAPAVRAAFDQRAAGATVEDVWRGLTDHGLTITYSGVYQLLQSRVYLGEIHFGKFTPNLAAHEPIVDRSTWEAVQRTKVRTGRKPASERLLARLGILRCGACNSRMAGSSATGARSVNGGGGKRYPVYRCGNKTCDQPVSIAAERAENAVTREVKRYLGDMAGRASAETGAQDAAATLERAQAELDTAIRTLSVVGDEPATIQRLKDLRDARDIAQASVDRLGGLQAALSVTAADWDRLTVGERRDLIVATVERAVVAPGRGRDRVSVHFFGE